MKHLLKNAKIYDGTGSAPFHGDILLEDDRIVAVGTMENPEADMVTDLEGRSVSSGFIDGHSHNDWFAIKKDPLPYFEPFIRQGITSFVTGNCGVSATGFEPGCSYMDHMGGGLFDYRNTTGEYGTIEEYCSVVDQNMPCNMTMLTGHCSARAAVGGIENRKLTPEEEKQMLAILLTVLVQDNEPYVLFMDEPEVSLHIEWQKQLIDLVLELNPNVQIILTTHSPAVIMNGWMDHVTEVSDILVNE